MERDPLSGRFVGKPKLSYATALWDLPQTNKEAVLFLQRHEILPKSLNGLELKIKTLNSRLGDSVNDNLTFHVPGTRKYPSFRPVTLKQAGFSLVNCIAIFYYISLGIKHNSISQLIGLQYVNYKGDTKSPTYAITSLRRN